jgi:hypothetical protein
VSALAAARLESYRRETFRLAPEARLRDLEEAIAFVRQRGFVFFWPISGITLPSLWAGVAGDRPVADAHDDPGHVTWGWKDQMLGQRRWYYAKVLRGRATMIDLEVAPVFYALSENYGDPERDHIQLYEQGLLTREARLIYETLLSEGPMDTVNLRRVIHMSGRGSDSPFERALTAVQRDFKAMPIGVAESGAWRYSFIYDLVHRYHPELPERARPIGRGEARERLAELYLRSVGAATAAEVVKLFQWAPADAARALERLATAGKVVASCRIEGRKGEYFALNELLAAGDAGQ